MTKSEIIAELGRRVLENADRSSRVMRKKFSDAKELESDNLEDGRRAETEILASAFGARAAEANQIYHLLKDYQSEISRDDNTDKVNMEEFPIITASVKNTVRKYFLFPLMGGEKVGDVTVITSESPLGTAILDRVVGEKFEYLTPDSRKISVEILAIE